MKSLLLTLIVSFAVTVPVAAQTTPAKEDLLRGGTNKIKAGAILMAAGTFLVLMEAPAAPGPLGPSVLGTGMGLVLWGTKQRADGLRPQLIFGATAGRTKGVYFSRRW